MPARHRRLPTLPLGRTAFALIVANEIRGLVTVALLAPTLIDWLR